MSENNVKVEIQNTVTESKTDLAPDDVVDAIIDATLKANKQSCCDKSKCVKDTCLPGCKPDEKACANGTCCNDKAKKKVQFIVDVESKAVVESLIDLEDFSVSKIPSLLPKLIKHVEHYKKMTGKQKRSMIIRMIKHIIDVTDGPGDDAFWDPIIKDLVPGMIDALLDVNDGKLKLRKRPIKMFGFLCCSKPEIDA